MPGELEDKNTVMPAEASGQSTRSTGWTLPGDLLAEAVRRLRAVALVYAVSYFIAGPLSSLLVPQARAVYVAAPEHWLPGIVSIAAALVVVGLASSARIGSRTKIAIGLGFEILGSVGIAAAEYHGVVAPITYAGGAGGFGVSWVAVWVLLFSVVVPSPPRITLPAAIVSLASVPIVYATGVAMGSNVALPPYQFLLGLVIPYLVVLLMVYVGSRVVYGLGAAVRQAREMGSYRLVEPLGKGGMGEVWRAQHRMLARPAAIKLIRPERFGATMEQSREVLRRFEREAQATALMRSPHTLELYDFGVASDGTFYYVMELLDGFDLDELVERFGPVPPERAIHFIRQICDSLSEAHAAGLIHRDIKPANLYTCRYGRSVDFVKVLDFGLVKHHGAPADDKLTAEHVAGGTPAYMSPEQAIADEELDARSDLYSVGCVAYWLLTGTPVFKGRTAMETMMMHVHRVPESLTSRTEQPIPPELEAIVLACLDKDATRRPQSADELGLRLSAVPTDGEWTSQRAQTWWDTHRPVTTRFSLPG
ncbi:MAG TPA: serine/threonine-protein kinase [Gemmatimonadales bacterium]|nr:serine/threonine-protein kinase [Gemmatimonadales bacterium]